VRVVITGSSGFIGTNFRLRLSELNDVTVIPVARDLNERALAEVLGGADWVFHLAGVNRPPHPDDFASGNAQYTGMLCKVLKDLPSPPRLVLSSSTQAVQEGAYGQSKLLAEEAALAYGQSTGAAVHIYRLPNVFGKWSRPNYNSAVATFCHNVARDLPISVHNPAAPLRLVYIDDVVSEFVSLLDPASDAVTGHMPITAFYDTTVGEVAQAIQGFRDSRNSLVSARVGTGLVRALYSTYVSFLPTSAFDYDVPRHGDARGVFVEMLKTQDSGQFSYFTAHPGVTRGEHYHHTKTEKFLVIRGHAHFGFRHVMTQERHEIVVNGGEGRIVETVPGWTHNITNIGQDELIVMLWANEIFDRQLPDTRACKV
jgi:UDP-2-acetamido-2,6-beta-L-arabino-hexul-4-ose reductase